jgi:hypothetical protein
VLTFDGGVSCHVFYLELALVLHHASTWAALAGGTIVVSSLADTHDGPRRELATTLQVDGVTRGNREHRAGELAGYLARTLGAEYLVDIIDDRLTVVWVVPGN